ncbi:MAG TPA: serine/threonine-protein kinase [Bryobacteraceae bacterium]|nr:serine/threonine-protein kinase [Bryobacteraceae bacterium]
MVIPERRKVGKYEILRKLGRGGMADVYLAQDPEIEHMVALKIIEQGPDPDCRETIEAERRGSELQAKLAEVDSRVVKIFDAGDMDGYFGVAMEYVEGEDLSELMRHGPAPVDDAVDIALAICQTLHNAHTLEVTIDGKQCRGIVHGDIKPKNIRIDNENRVRVLDFGIAKALSLSRRLTRNEFGSVPYASPERLDSGQVNIMSDLWSLGVLLYEMVAGSQPYQAESTERLERMIRARIPAPPAPDPCPEPLRRILLKSMDPDPGRRYQSAADLAADLAAFRAGAAVSAEVKEDLDATRRTFGRTAAPDDATRRTTAKPPARAPIPVAAQPVSEAQRKAKRFVVAVAGLALAYVVYAVTSDVVLWRNGQQLERDIHAETTTDPEAIWTRWAGLSKHSPQSLALFGPRRAVKKTLVEEADRVIETYRNGDTQPVYENDWKRARLYLARALELDPGDETVRGKLRLCEGQIDRINGISHRNVAMLNEAVQKFEEAEQALPRSPDPELGMARVYVYGLKDIDRAYAALQQAEHNGYQLGSREKAQLADGYRDRGDRLWWDSRNVRGLPQEKDQIQKAADDYRRALQLYQSIVPYANANINIARVQSSLNGIETRLAEIQAQTATPPPAN